MQQNKWMKSDELQWIRQEGENTFDIINAYTVDDDCYDVTYHVVDLADYTKEELLAEIRPFSYESLQDVKKVYGDAWKQIVAECISKNDAAGNETSMNPIELVDYLQGYGIEEELLEAIG